MLHLLLTPCHFEPASPHNLFMLNIWTQCALNNNLSKVDLLLPLTRDFYVLLIVDFQTASRSAACPPQLRLPRHCRLPLWAPPACLHLWMTDVFVCMCVRVSVCVCRFIYTSEAVSHSYAHVCHCLCQSHHWLFTCSPGSSPLLVPHTHKHRHTHKHTHKHSHIVCVAIWIGSARAYAAAAGRRSPLHPEELLSIHRERFCDRAWRRYQRSHCSAFLWRINEGAVPKHAVNHRRLGDVGGGGWHDYLSQLPPISPLTQSSLSLSLSTCVLCRWNVTQPGSNGLSGPPWALRWTHKGTDAGKPAEVKQIQTYQLSLLK